MPDTKKPIQVLKRDGRVVDFNEENIYNAMVKAASTVYAIDDKFRLSLRTLTHRIVADLVANFSGQAIPIYAIQAAVEKFLLGEGLLNTAQHYIEYRLQQDVDRAGFDNLAVTVRIKAQ